LPAAAIYARYSSDLQNPNSVEDQFRVCRELVANNGWSVAGEFSDAAISGVTLERPGFRALVKAALDGQFQVIVSEALDRLSRNLSDIARFYEELSFAGVKVVTIAEGEVSELHVGLKGTMNSLFLKDMKAKMHRGKLGRIANGRAAGGLGYGYRAIRRFDEDGEPVRGERKIDKKEAKVVRQIFRLYAAGMSPLAIAVKLNSLGHIAPKGGPWTHGTIFGQRRKGTGVLNNELYIGRLVWGRTRTTRRIDSGGKIILGNPPEKWIVKQVPHLRIVSDDIWQRVKARQTLVCRPWLGQSLKFRRIRNMKYLFSRLLKCGKCGANMVQIQVEQYACAAHSNQRSWLCSNKTRINFHAFKDKLLDAIRDKAFNPANIRMFKARMRQVWSARKSNRSKVVDAVKRDLACVETDIAHLVAAIRSGTAPAILKPMFERAERERNRLQQFLKLEDPAFEDIEKALDGEIDNLRRLVGGLETAPNWRLSKAHNLSKLLIGSVMISRRKNGSVVFKFAGIARYS
jgi:site-specific DNA recombinase